ncbi:hypothetical protein P7H70_10950 [Vagococcus carniphilus]|uniref:Uncharacterized protein n=1 Tax=Vagococcus carniphilus TaxID=218144 RepID=A0AAW8U9Q0_9ENTE|nr:hypothetical protein [Vagococcus carniphilus]MDT2814546.1 hypothetical protein [Vagococcus carniphilus]MDT2834552.1 hypothetical protein [Vagococcus carniphilus]
MNKNEINSINNKTVEIKSPLFKKRKTNKGEQGIKFLTDFTMMVPGLVESISFDTKYVVDISAEISKKIADGSLQLMTKSNGETLAVLTDSKTKHIIQQLPIKTELITPALGPAMLAVGLFIQIKKIEKGIDNLNKGISEVLQNFEDDRYARAFSAKEKFEQAVLFSNQQLKQDFLLNILDDVTNTKHMLYKQLTHKVERLINRKKGFIDNSKNELANEALQNLYLFNEVFKIQIECYAELDEYFALSHALNMYENEINTVLTKEVQLAVDGFFKESTNPFSHAILEVISSVNQTNNFLLENEVVILDHLNEKKLFFDTLKEQEILNTYD